MCDGQKKASGDGGMKRSLTANSDGALLAIDLTGYSGGDLPYRFNFFKSTFGSR